MVTLCHHKDGCRERPEGCDACFQCKDITMSGLIASGLTPRQWSRSHEPHDLDRFKRMAGVVDIEPLVLL
jgi:hypothetical protein